MDLIEHTVSEDLVTNYTKEVITYFKLTINQIRGKYSRIHGPYRIKYYILVWKFFVKKAKPEENDYHIFEQYVRFFDNVSFNTRNFTQYFLPCVFVLMVIGSFVDLYITHIFNLLLILALTILFGAIFFLRQSKLRQLSSNEKDFKEFSIFIHPGKLRKNFNFFKSIDLNDETAIGLLYEHFTNKNNIGGPNETLTVDTHDTTIKLLALDFLLSGQGGIDTVIEKLINTNRNVTKDSIYIVLSKILGTNETNIEKSIRYNLPKFHSGESATKAKIDKLDKVKEFFVEAKLDIIVQHIDKVIRKNVLQPTKKQKLATKE